MSYVMQDHLGSTVGTLDASGNQVNTTVYSEFGSVSYAAGTLPTDKKFTGQRLDSTGLYYYGARYYDPEIGRFISPDTVVQNPADPQTLNRYSYCLNNPLVFIDPSGHVVYVNGNNVSEYYNFVEMIGMGVYTMPTTAVINLMADPLFIAYDMARSVVSDMMNTLEHSTSIVKIQWDTLKSDLLGDATPTQIVCGEKQYASEVTIRINSRLDSWLPGKDVWTAEVIAHECFHATVAINGVFGDSRYEETCAFSIGRAVHKAFGSSVFFDWANPLDDLTPSTPYSQVKSYVVRNFWNSYSMYSNLNEMPPNYDLVRSLYVGNYPSGS